MSAIHATAVIDSKAQIAENCDIGPYCVIGAGARIAAGVTLAPHSVIDGDITIGEGCQIGPFNSLGAPAQHVRARESELGRVLIGAGTVTREHVTINAGMLSDDRTTSVGTNCFLMTASHVAHDCVVGDDAILVNQATLAGHVHIGQGAIISGLSAVHQHARVGQYAFVGGMTGVEFDVIPYGMATGNRARLDGLNLIGLKRRGVTRADIQALRAAYQSLFAAETPLAEAIESCADAHGGNSLVDEVLDFMRAGSKRRFCTPAA